MWCDRHRAQVRLVPDLADSLSQRQFTELLCTHRSMSRFKFGVAAVKGPLESLPMTRVSVDGGSLLKHVVAAQLQLPVEEAVEKISRLEVFTSYDTQNNTKASHTPREHRKTTFWHLFLLWVCLIVFLGQVGRQPQIRMLNTWSSLPSLTSLVNRQLYLYNKRSFNFPNVLSERMFSCVLCFINLKLWSLCRRRWQTQESILQSRTDLKSAPCACISIVISHHRTSVLVSTKLEIWEFVSYSELTVVYL